MLSSGFGCALPLLVGMLGCVCMFMRVPRLHPAIPGGVVSVCVDLGFVCSPVFSWLGCWGAWPLVCAASVSRHLTGGRLWREGVRVFPWVGVPPPSPLCFFFCGGACRGVTCRSFVVSIAGCPGPGSRGLCPPFSSRSGCAFVFFSSSPPL